MGILDQKIQDTVLTHRTVIHPFTAYLRKLLLRENIHGVLAQIIFDENLDQRYRRLALVMSLAPTSSHLNGTIGIFGVHWSRPNPLLRVMPLQSLNVVLRNYLIDLVIDFLSAIGREGSESESEAEAYYTQIAFALIKVCAPNDANRLLGCIPIVPVNLMAVNEFKARLRLVLDIVGFDENRLFAVRRIIAAIDNLVVICRPGVGYLPGLEIVTAFLEHVLLDVSREVTQPFSGVVLELLLDYIFVVLPKGGDFAALDTIVRDRPDEACDLYNLVSSKSKALRAAMAWYIVSRLKSPVSIGTSPNQYFFLMDVIQVYRESQYPWVREAYRLLDP